MMSALAINVGGNKKIGLENVVCSPIMAAVSGSVIRFISLISSPLTNVKIRVPF